MMLKIGGFLFPFVGSTALFLVLYNNSYNGILIVCGVIPANLLLMVLPRVAEPWASGQSTARLAALYVSTAIVAFLGLEALFPYALPAEYAKIRDLSKRMERLGVVRPSAFSVVFANGTEAQFQKASFAQTPEHGSGSLAWHVPNGSFEYYGYEPNEQFRYVNLIRWNSHGYYDRDRSLDKPPGTYRVVIIGDSYVESLQVPLEKTFHKRLEHALNHAGGLWPGTRFEVIALGNSGSGQKRSLEVLQNLGMRFDPDLVILTLCPNDFCDDHPDLRHERSLAVGEATREVRNLARHRYYFAAFALGRVNEIRRNRISVSPELLQWSKDNLPRIEEGWRRCLSYVEEAATLTQDRNIALLLAYTGDTIEVEHRLNEHAVVAALRSEGNEHKRIEWDLHKTEKRLADFCAERSIPFISMIAPLSHARRITGKHVFGDHYTIFGHQVVGETLFHTIRSMIEPPGLQIAEHDPVREPSSRIVVKPCRFPAD